ncbi:MAG: copper homeostasis protein CutC, partial [Bacteroidales bacterium]|nr:copper homeostasis protein CutC [Bacteroidales bacterium]
MSVLVEVCLESVESALIAEKSGASRIELCSALDLGGISPSKALIEEVCNAVKIPVFVLIRPRQGNFIYTNSEIKLMIRDIEIAIESGAKGIVSGALDNNYNIDIQATKELIKTANNLPFTFHRAFDQVAKPFEALNQIIDLGAKRILTSGQKPKAI